MSDSMGNFFVIARGRWNVGQRLNLVGRRALPLFRPLHEFWAETVLDQQEPLHAGRQIRMAGIAVRLPILVLRSYGGLALANREAL
jgi:hypothetical protein